MNHSDTLRELDYELKIFNEECEYFIDYLLRDKDCEHLTAVSKKYIDFIQGKANRIISLIETLPNNEKYLEILSKPASNVMLYSFMPSYGREPGKEEIRKVLLGKTKDVADTLRDLRVVLNYDLENLLERRKAVSYAPSECDTDSDPVVVSRGRSFLNNWWAAGRSNVVVATKVNAAIYAPAEVARGGGMMVQAFLYENRYADRIAGLAKQADADAECRNYTALSRRLCKGDKLRFVLKTFPEVDVQESEYETEWQGEMSRHEFLLRVPDNFRDSHFFCTVVILVNGVAVGDMKFKTSVICNEPRRLWAEVECNNFRSTFISYMSADQDKVQFIAKAFELQKQINGIDYFFAPHSLKNGDNYPREIADYIDRCDVFVLCWSENARHSDWVRREYTQALDRYHSRNDILMRLYSIAPHAPLPTVITSEFHIEIIA